MVTPEQRLAKIKAASCDSWISPEQFKCVCGETFRYKTNFQKHIKECCEYKFNGEQKD